MNSGIENEFELDVLELEDTETDIATTASLTSTITITMSVRCNII
ncbi:hypothetical protein [Streptomyces sp. NPDC002159]